MLRWCWLTALLGLGVVALGSLTGCLESCYLVQAIYGQDDIAWRARPIAEVLADEAVPRRTRALLAVTEDVARFGAAHGLTPTDSYREYVALDRDAVVWTVSAAPPLALTSKTWWFPIVGSVPYLGWFNRRDAERQAARLASEGWDVEVRAASAYSTLGWMSDPVLSTMLRERPGVVGDLVEVVLHESVHATHYVSSQTYFNESLADFVAEELTARYLGTRLALDGWQLYDYREAVARGSRRAARMHAAYLELEALYASRLAAADKLRAKQRITAALAAELGIARPINNATLAQSRQYHGAEPIFGELWRHCGGDWGRFWALVRGVGEGDFEMEQQEDVDAALRPRLGRACPAVGGGR
jgi:predicted aminopeptidase